MPTPAATTDARPPAIGPEVDWRREFYEFEDAVYLNAAGDAPIPRVSVKALERAVERKKRPHLQEDEQFFGLPNRVRALLAQLLGGKPEEVAVTSGASTGLAAVANGLDWRPDDEVLIARGEFPAHFSTWVPLSQAGKLKVQVVEPAGACISEEDFIARLGKNTRLVSASLVRFDDSARLDAARLAAACKSAGALLLLDVSQAAGAVPLDLSAIDADFAVCSGYKWLLSPFGTGFFWIRQDHIEEMQRRPFYWMALAGASKFHSLWFQTSQIVPEAGEARRWDAPETASFFHLAVMEASLEFLHRVGVPVIWQHIGGLLEQVVARLPLDRCVLASPREAARRGPYVCVKARSSERTRELNARLREKQIYVSLREDALRIAPHLYNTPRDMDRLLEILAV